MTWPRVTLQTTLLVAMVAIPTLLVAQVTKDRYGLKGVSLEGGIAYARSVLKAQGVVDRALRTPGAWANTLAAPPPGWS